MTRKSDPDWWYKEALELTERSGGIILDEWGFFTTKEEELRKLRRDRRLQNRRQNQKLRQPFVETRRAELTTVKPPLPGIAEFKKTVDERVSNLLKDPELVKRFDETTDRWLVGDYPARHLMLWAYASAFGDDPLNVNVSGKYGIGKSTIVVRTSSLLPEDMLWSLGGLTPTALVHEYGEFDEAKAEHVISLRGKVIVFLDTPDPETLARLKPIYSHDKQEIVFKFTDRDKEGRFRTTTAKLVDHPVFIHATAKAEFAGEYASRWLTVTPEISGEKVGEVLMKQAERAASKPDMLVDEDLEVWRSFFRSIPSGLHVTIPYAPLMARRFVKHGTETMRLFEHFLRLIKANAILHYAQRERDSTDIVASVEDLKRVLPDFKSIVRQSLYGVSGDALMLFDGLIETKSEKALSLVEIGKIASRVFGLPVAESTLRNVYVKSLLEAGLLDEETDMKDKRRRLYSVKPIERINVFHDEAALLAEVEGRQPPEPPENIKRNDPATAQPSENAETATTQDSTLPKDWIERQIKTSHLIPSDREAAR
jgi:hypothetical protein